MRKRASTTLKTEKQLLGLAASLASTSARLGLGVDVLQAAKAAGCPHFQGSGRVELDGLVEWLADSSFGDGIGR